MQFIKSIRIITKDNKVYEGLLLNEIKEQDKEFIIIKLDNGYNIGIDNDKIKEIRVIEEKSFGSKKYQVSEQTSYDSTIYILNTGGTIASRVDYETGAVKSLFKPEELLELFPEIKGNYNIKSKLLFNIFSEDFTFKVYNKIIDEIKKIVESNEKVRGIILTHGTDTMHYTSAALKFAIRGLPFPVVIVGAQRSSDRPSTDARFNLIAAVNFINYVYEHNEKQSKIIKPDVYVSMHGSIEDTFSYIFDAFNVRKMHTSRRDAFRQINDLPLAKVYYDGKIEILNEKIFTDHPDKNFSVSYYNDSLKIGILYVHPNLIPDEILAYKNFDALVIAATGLGHMGINKSLDNFVDNTMNYEALKELINNDVIIAVAPQTINGRINLNVYSTGRLLKKLGILGNLTDMTIETAFIKLAYLLSNYEKDKVKELYNKNLFGEVNLRSKFLETF